MILFFNRLILNKWIILSFCIVTFFCFIIGTAYFFSYFKNHYFETNIAIYYLSSILVSCFLGFVSFMGIIFLISKTRKIKNKIISEKIDFKENFNNNDTQKIISCIKNSKYLIHYDPDYFVSSFFTNLSHSIFHGFIDINISDDYIPFMEEVSSFLLTYNEKLSLQKLEEIQEHNVIKKIINQHKTKININNF